MIRNVLLMTGIKITGEERLRESLTDLDGNIVFYDGRPSQTQVERADALARELADAETPGADPAPDSAAVGGDRPVA